MLKNKCVKIPITFNLVSIGFLFAEIIFENNSLYVGVIWLTVAYIVCNFFFIEIYKENNLFLLLVMVFNFIKYVITPFLIIMTDNVTVFHFNSIENINHATVLMIYDLIVMMILFWIYFHSSRTVRKNEKFGAINEWHMDMNIILISYIILVIAVFLFIPQSRSMFKTVFDMSDETFTHDGTFVSSSDFSGFTRISLTLFGVLFSVVRLLVPLYLILETKKTRLNELVKILISLMLILLELFFITSTIAEALIDMMVLFVLLILLYPDKEKALFRVMGIVGGVFVVMYFVIRYSFNVGYAYNYSVLEYLSNLLNSYVPGVNSIAACIDINTDNPYKLLFDSLYYCIPFNTTLFGYTGISFSTVFNNFNSVRGQIPPSVGMIYTCLGGVFVPLGSACVALAGVHCYEKAKHHSSLGKKACYIVMSFYLCSAIGVYNFQISFRYLLNLALFISIVFAFDRRKKEWKR